MIGVILLYIWMANRKLANRKCMLFRIFLSKFYTNLTPFTKHILFLNLFVAKRRHPLVMVAKQDTFLALVQNTYPLYSGPCDLRPLYLTITCILIPDISETNLIFSIETSLYFKTTFNLRPYFAG